MLVLRKWKETRKSIVVGIRVRDTKAITSLVLSLAPGTFLLSSNISLTRFRITRKMRRRMRRTFRLMTPKMSILLPTGIGPEPEIR